MHLHTLVRWSTPLSVVFSVILTPVGAAASEPQSSPKSSPKTSVEQPKLEEQGGPLDVQKSRYRAEVGARGMVVSDDQQASAWGAEILRKGGNAIDAAVASAFALAVTRPHFASLGGGGFLIYCPKPIHNKGQPCTVIDYREKAPKNSSPDMYVKDGVVQTELSQNSALAIGVPGVPAGLLLAHKKFGKLPRQKILSKPIQLAKKGYLFTGYSESSIYKRWDNLNPAAQKIFGCSKTDLHSPASFLKRIFSKRNSNPNSSNIKRWPCPAGTIIKQPDLAQVLYLLSKKGEKAFYEGEIAKKISHAVIQAGGILTEKDLADYQPTLRTPVVGKFAEWEVVTMPPPSSGGGILLQLLGYTERAIQAGYFKNGIGSPDGIHTSLHAMSLAYADRTKYYGDPDFVANPLEHLLKPSYLDERWKTFKLSKARLPGSPGIIPTKNEPDHTTHFSVVDREGNAVAITTTINDSWGSGFVPEGTGIVMNNEMDDFSIRAGTPNLFKLIGNEANAIRPGKKPLSSMSPTILRDSDGNNQIVLGAAGGSRIPTAVYLTLLNHLVFNLSIADAVAYPRFHHQWNPKEIVFENNGFPKEIQEALQEKGYTLGNWSISSWVHALRRYPNGRVWGAADPRGDGAAVAE